MDKVPSYDKVEKKAKQLDVYPLKKGKRVLVYLSDLVISFFIAFLLFSFVAVPLSQAATNLESRRNQSHEARLERNIVLVSNGLLYQQYENEPLNDSMEYTANQYIRYYSDSEILVSNPDIFYTFYFSTRDYSNQYISSAKKCDVGGFFDYDEANNKISLKTEYKEEFHEGFLSGNKLIGKGKSDYDKLYKTFFFNMYGLILKDANKNDLTATGHRSYLTCQKIMQDYNKFFNNVATVDTYIATIVSFSICFLLIPLIDKRGRTISMLMIRVDKVDKTSLELTGKKATVFSFFYNIFLNLWIILFVPMMGVGLEVVFDLPSIFPISIISFLLMLVGLFSILFDQYNRSLSDKLIHAVELQSDTLDDIYRARGYYL